MAWATQVDTEEAEGAAALPALPATFKAAGKAPESFPSLGDAAKVVETKAEKKKKAQKMSLAEFRCAHPSLSSRHIVKLTLTQLLLSICHVSWSQT